jgi:hypothetical protein
VSKHRSSVKLLRGPLKSIPFHASPSLMEEAGNRPRVENRAQHTQSATLTFVPSKRTPNWHPNDPVAEGHPVTTPEEWREGSTG